MQGMCLIRMYCVTIDKARTRWLSHNRSEAHDERIGERVRSGAHNERDAGHHRRDVKFLSPSGIAVCLCVWCVCVCVRAWRVCTMSLRTFSYQIGNIGSIHEIRAIANKYITVTKAT